MSKQGKKMFDDVSSDGAAVREEGPNNRADESDASTSFTGSSSDAAAAAPRQSSHVDPAAATSSQTSVPAAAATAVTPQKTPTPAAAKGENKNTNAAASVSTPMSTSQKPLAPTPSSTRVNLGIPATVSKRPEREELEDMAHDARFDSAGKPSPTNGTASAKYCATDDEPVYASHRVAGTQGSRSPRKTAPTRGRNMDSSVDVSNLNHFGDDDSGDNGAASFFLSPNEAAASAVEGFIVPYLFPRLDSDLAEWDEPDRELAMGKSRYDEVRRAPPNCVESSCAYLLAADKRLSLYFVLLCLSLVFTVVSIPTAQIDISSAALLEEVATNMVLTPEGVYNFSNAVNVKSCYTYWGYKEDCDAAPYTLPVGLMKCAGVRTRLQAGAAFSIISLFVYLVLLFMTVIMMCCLTESPRVREKNRRKNTKGRWVIGSVGLVCVVTQLICWAAIAAVRNSYNCVPPASPTTAAPTAPVIDDAHKAYGVGFGLCVTAWCLNVAGVVQLLAVPGFLMNKVGRS